MSVSSKEQISRNNQTTSSSGTIRELGQADNDTQDVDIENFGIDREIFAKGNELDPVPHKALVLRRHIRTIRITCTGR